jgi:hypothetical protein
VTFVRFVVENIARECYQPTPTTNIAEQQGNICGLGEKPFGWGEGNHIHCARAKVSLAHFLDGINIRTVILQR